MSAETPLDAAACSLLTHLSLQPPLPAHHPSDTPAHATALATVAGSKGKNSTTPGRDKSHLLTGNMAAAFAAPGLFGWEGQQQEHGHYNDSQPKKNKPEGGSRSSACAFQGGLLPRLALPAWLPGRGDFEAAVLALGVSRHLLERDEECIRRAEAGEGEGEGGAGELRAAQEAAEKGSSKQHKAGGGQGSSTARGETRGRRRSSRDGGAGEPPRPVDSSGESCLAVGSREEERSQGTGLPVGGLQPPGEATLPPALPDELASVKAGADATAAALGWQQRKARLLLQLLGARCLGQQLHALGER